MFKITALLKKTALAALVLAIGLALFPVTGASAAGLADQTPIQPGTTRLERVWMRQQAIFRRESSRLEKASTFIERVQSLIDRANAQGWDASNVQEALDDLGAVIPAVQAAHDPGTGIIASHAGFDATGRVIDREEAMTTIKSLDQVLRNTRAAMDGSGQALRKALRDFREAHPRPAITPDS